MTPCYFCLRTEVLGRHTSCLSFLIFSVVLSSVVKHWTLGMLVQERGCPWALWGEAQSRAGFTHSSFLLPQLSLPPTFLPLITRGVPETRRWHLHCSRQIPRWAVGPSALLSPSHLPLPGALSAVFTRTLALDVPAHRVAPLPTCPLEPGMVTFFFLASCRFAVTSVPDSRFGQWDCPWTLGELSVGISCYFRQWWRSRTWPCPSSWRNGDVRTWLGGIWIGTPGRRIMGTWFPRVRWLQDYCLIRLYCLFFC